MDDAAEMVKCEQCGKEVTARGLGVHIARVHGKGWSTRPKGAPVSFRCESCGEKFSSQNGLNAHSQHCKRREAGATPTAAPQRRANGCLLCAPGQNAAWGHNILERMVRGGMSLGPAAALTTEVLAIVGE